MENLAGADQILEHRKGFLDRGGPVPTVLLVEVDVVDPQPAQAGVHGGHDVLARGAALVSAGPGRGAELGGDDHVRVPPELAQRLAEHNLAGALGIDVGGVEEVDSPLERLAEERHRLVFGQRPAGVHPALAVAHAAERQRRDLETGTAKVEVLHRMAFL
jgi:hypothetical protein